MSVYSVRGFTGATAASVDQALCQLWNGSSTEPIEVLEFGIFTSSTTHQRTYAARSSAQGTASATTTPDTDNNWDGAFAPPSGAVLNTAFSAQPTLIDPKFWGAHTGTSGVGGSGGAGYCWTMPDGFVVLPGTGLVLVSADAIAWGASECYFVWAER